jgi:hypothetical protein
MELKKDIKVNFIFPSNEKGKKAVYDDIRQFNREVILTYINNLNCDYDDKIRVFNNFCKSPPLVRHLQLSKNPHEIGIN